MYLRRAKECQQPYLAGIPMDYERAIEIWTQTYRHGLDHPRRGGTWVFVHYDQVLDGSAAARLGNALGAPVNTSFADTALRRSSPAGPVSADAEEVYRQLCGWADFRPAHSAHRTLNRRPLGHLGFRA